MGINDRVFKIIGRFLAIAAAAIALALMIAMIIYPAEYVRRVLVWQNSDVGDYARFSARSIEAPEQAHQYETELDEEGVSAVFERSSQVDDWPGFLEETCTQAFIVILDDTIIYEGYFNDIQRDSIVTSFSVAKSFDSALIGIAIDEGHINSVNDPITEYLPELLDRDVRFADITIRHLLMMASGIRYEEFPFLNGDDAKTYYYPDLRRLALEKTQITGTPGQEFLYNNYHPLLLGLIIERATGQPVATYLQDKIWQPLGMAYDASWSLDSPRSGLEKMESGINGRAIDFARFGNLYLNGGRWGDKQIISADWVVESITAGFANAYPEYYANNSFGASIYDQGHGAYHYMWYSLNREDAPDDFYAAGNLGQYIYISPHKNMIIVRFGMGYGIEHFEWISLFYDFASAYPEVTFP